MINIKPNRMMKIGIIIFAVLTLGIIGYAAKNVVSNQLLPSSPQYVVSHAIDAYKQHNPTTFSNYVDINSVAASVNTSWHAYEKNSSNKAFISCPASTAPGFTGYINNLVNGSAKLIKSSKTNIGIDYILLSISDYKITNIKNTADDVKSFDLVAKSTENSSIVIPMTIKKSGDDWKISSINVTNLFAAYDNEVKRQAIEFGKTTKAYQDKLTAIYGNVNSDTDIGPFIEERTYEDMIKRYDDTENLLKSKLDNYNKAIAILNNIPDTNEVGKIYKYYALDILNYGVKKATIQIDAVRKINENYKTAYAHHDSGIQETFTLNSKNIDIYGDADKSIKKLGHVQVILGKLKTIDNLMK
ncbi:MAG: hypothetical protein LKI76_04325 [Megasphaera sp.]|jgi:hypothetical protein|nr:hypothetical protein [Megasphaera sp.]